MTQPSLFPPLHVDHDTRTVPITRLRSYDDNKKTGEKGCTVGEKKYYHAHTRLLRVRLRCTRVSESSKIPISLLSGGDSPRAQGNEKFIMKIATEFFFFVLEKTVRGADK